MRVMARHVKNHKKKRHGTAFWDSEYKNASHLALSLNPSEDMLKFVRWLLRYNGRTLLNPIQSVTDLGCGNGRNIIALTEEYSVRGIGYDSSAAAIKDATKRAAHLPITFETRSIAGALDIPSESQSIVLDMMSSHFLDQSERLILRDEIFRILKPGGFLFMKTFLSDGDIHTRRLIAEYPGKEAGTYVHPVIGVSEYVYTEEALVTFLQERFIIHKTYPSHKHVSRGRARKRRTISVYAEKDPYT